MRLLTTTLLLACALPLFAGCPAKAPETKTPETTDKPAETPPVEEPAEAEEAKVTLAEGMAFPSFQEKTWKDEDFNFDDHLNKGKYILVDFWAGWCGPCLRDMPNLIRVQNENQNERFEIVSISLDEPDTKTRLEDAVAKFGITFPIITDWKRWKSRFVDEYGVHSIPANFLLAPDGTILIKDLHGQDLIDVTHAFATKADLDYQPITLTASVINMPDGLDKKAGVTSLPVEPLTLSLKVTNPQAGDASFQVGVKVTTYVRQGGTTGRKRDDGTYVIDKETNTYVIYHPVQTMRQTLTAEGTGGVADVTITIPIPEGTMDAELVPYVYSPALDMTVPGQGIYPSWTTDILIDEEDLAKQGGVIDLTTLPKLEPPPAEEPEPAEEAPPAQT